MADPICRWRNPYVGTVLELIKLLPKEELDQSQARAIVAKESSYDFYRTPYQLACQLGLYHETDGRYFPRFSYVPSIEEVKKYLRNWIIHYCVPNPYTKSFPNLVPFSIHAEICKSLYESKAALSWDDIKNIIFNGQIGNNDILVNSINSYSPIIKISQTVTLKSGNDFDDLEQFINVDTIKDRNNKEYFFDLFTDKNIDTNGENEIDLEVIKEVKNEPTLSQTEKSQIIMARVGQGIFRRTLIQETNYCPITQIDDTNLLIASHIKPWRNSSNNERINPKNGLLLTPTFDRLFDKGFISFTNDKKLIISPHLTNLNIERLSIKNEMLISKLPIEGREEYLDYHREHILK